MAATTKRSHSLWVFISMAVILLSTYVSEANFTMDVQGSIFCTSPGNKVMPISGATAKIICKASKGRNVSIISSQTNTNGFYTASSSTRFELRKCKAFLNSSPLPSCNSPTNINGGRDGSALIPFSSSDKSRSKHYSVKPFSYTST